ncbi:hypothetical protein GE061_008597 [Apolygus lucorum]|uniref:Uncharacterized protein n=1 Tax=Apolygus lucorum TaxID=248454 RepID=A0A8S9WN54_APOLU|nr:hypothetical protein GE061_008597 [Apolygus lucorum]
MNWTSTRKEKNLLSPLFCLNFKSPTRTNFRKTKLHQSPLLVLIERPLEKKKICSLIDSCNSVKSRCYFDTKRWFLCALRHRRIFDSLLEGYPDVQFHRLLHNCCRRSQPDEITSKSSWNLLVYSTKWPSR